VNDGLSIPVTVSCDQQRAVGSVIYIVLRPPPSTLSVGPLPPVQLSNSGYEQITCFRFHYAILL